MVHKVSVSDARALLDQGGITIVDVREPHEWKAGHLPGAIHVPLGQLRAEPSIWSSRVGFGPLLFVCERGARSLQAAEFAEARGLSAIHSLDGGTAGWRAAGLPIETPPEVAVDDAGAPELDAIVGENLKRLRDQRGYSLDMLAGLTGVGRQILGQIELGRTVPSVGTLWKIATALEVPFSALLAQKATRATRIFRRAGAKRIVDADGRFASRALFSPDDKGGVELYELWLAAHGREEAEAHAPGTRENLVVTAGRAVIEIAKEQFELATGDAIAFTADVPHAYINPSGEECWMSLVMSYAPGG